MNITYGGKELDLFSQAKNWKKYWSRIVLPFVGESVLEVGAGIGVNVKLLMHENKTTEWVCLEPDSLLFSRILSDISKNGLDKKVKAFNKTLSQFENAQQKFSTIIYIDVLEHISSDHEELKLASEYIHPEGYLIVLCPAHNFLFSKFDKAIGHFRRYDKKMIKRVLPENFEIIQLKYLDCLGLFASLTNKLFLKQHYPTSGQIQFWDSFMIPLSMFFDKMIFYSLGKSILLISKKNK